MANRKRMTIAEKRGRAETKKRLQEEGILPPDKQKLNRKAFIESAKQEWKDRGEGCYIWDLYVIQAVFWMLGKHDKKLNISLEAVAAAKVLLIALRLKGFSDKLKEEGRTTYSVIEQHDFIKDILDA